MSARREPHSLCGTWPGCEGALVVLLGQWLDARGEAPTWGNFGGFWSRGRLIFTESVRSRAGRKEAGARADRADLAEPLTVSFLAVDLTEPRVFRGRSFKHLAIAAGRAI